MHDVQTDPDDRAIMKSIIALARNMGLKIIAEGAETQAQFEFWRLWVVTIFRAMPWGIRYVQATLATVSDQAKTLDEDILAVEGEQS